MNDSRLPPRKIAVVVPAYCKVGGGERFASEITKRLAQNPDFEMHVLAGSWEVNADNIHFHWVPVIRFPRFLRPLVFAWYVRRIAKRIGFDLIHTHHWIFGADIYSLHGTPHAYWRREVTRRPPRLYDRALMAVERIAMRENRNSYFLSVSSIAMEAFRKEYPSHKGCWQLMPPGVEVARYALPDRMVCRSEIRQLYRIGERDIVLLFVGQNFALKGLDTVIAALAKARAARPEANIKLLVVGRGDAGKYRKVAEKQGVGDAVEFAGMQREGLERYYRAADIFLLFSSFDTFGMVVLEAMAAGLPVVVSPNVGAKDLVEEGGNGYILPAPQDADSGADRIVRLVDDGLREKMGEAAAQTASMHDWDRLAEKMALIYKDVCNK